MLPHGYIEHRWGHYADIYYCSEICHLMPDPTKLVTLAMTEDTQCVKEKVVIIIPTYNEASVIGETITEIFKTVTMMTEFEVNVLIFDSASTDRTAQIVIDLQKYFPHLVLQQENKKSGLGSAYLQAMEYALSHMNADIVFEFDADLSHQPKYIPLMLETIKTCDVVVGSRYVKGGSIPKDWGWHRQLLSVFGNYVARAFLTAKYKDLTSGFRATRRHALQNILPKKFISNQYAYKLQLFWLLHKNSAKICEIPIDFIDRTKGDSKLPRNTILDSLRVVFTLRYREVKQYFKMCLVGALGMLVQFIIYNLLRIHITPFSASQIAVLAAIVNNYLLNSSFTFKSGLQIPRVEVFRRVTRFMVYSLVMIYLQSYWLKLGISYLGTGTIQENSILALGIGLSSLINYFIYSRHIWPESRKQIRYES